MICSWARIIANFVSGGLTEWPIVAVSKTAVRLCGPGVRIPHPPQITKSSNACPFLFSAIIAIQKNMDQ